MSTALQPSFLRFLLFCPFGQHRAVECDCCGAVSCLGCRTELEEREELEL